MRCVWANLSKAVFPSCVSLLVRQPWTVLWSTSFLSHHSSASRVSVVWPNSFLFSGHEKHIPTAEIFPELKYIFLELLSPQTSLKLRGSHPFSEALLGSRLHLTIQPLCLVFSSLLKLTEQLHQLILRCPVSVVTFS